MDIKKFFELSAGKWFSQRTSYGLSFKESDSGQGNIIIDILAADDPQVVQLCERHAIEPSLAWGGAKISSEGQSGMPWERKIGQTNPTPTDTLIVPIADDISTPDRGKILHSWGNNRPTPVTGKYILGNDEALTLITEYENIASEERIWFASPNLRLRTMVFTGDGLSMASFSSEIRLGGGK